MSRYFKATIWVVTATFTAFTLFSFNNNDRFFEIAKSMNVLLEKPTLTQLLMGTIIPALLMVPINFRISRSIFLHLFGGIDFKPELYEK